MAEFKVARRPGKIQLVNDSDTDAADSPDVIAETDGTTISIKKALDLPTAGLTLNGDITVDSIDVAADTTSDVIETNKDAGYTGNFIDFKLNGSNRLTVTSGGNVSAPGTMFGGAFSSTSYVLTGTQYTRVFADPMSFGLDATNAPSVATTYGYALSFDDTTQELTYFNLRLPNNYVAGEDIPVTVFWSPATTNTGDCYWSLGVQELTVGASPVAAVFTIGIQAGNGTAGQLQSVSLTALDGTNFQEGDILSCRFVRAAADVLDTMTGDALLHGIRFDVPVNNLVET